MDLLITDALVITCDDAARILDRAAVAVSGDRIAALGSTETLARDFPSHQRMDGRGLAIFPGFINAHTHTILTSLRGTVEDWDGNAVYAYM
jgi:5-methylthioadenosine/S-adenosylhomocysteine deaminase